MINEYYAKKFCCEDISLIENYQNAVADKTQMWHCHHRLECVDGIYTSRDELKEKGLINGRPANELIFLTSREHKKIHNNDPAKRKKLSEAMKGKKFGPHSEESKIKMSEAHKGKTPWNKGKKLSAEHRKHMSEAMKGKKFGPCSDEHKKHLSESHKGRHYWNNGLVCKMCKKQPGPDFVRGRLRIQ